MQLKLKVASGEEISVDVKSTDSFQDLTDRLSQYGNIKIDLSELGPAVGKTFHLSANVFDFFDVKKDKKEDKADDIFATLCRLCGESVGSSPHYLFEETGEGIPSLAEKINASIPIQVTTNEFVPQQICTSCLNDVNEAYSTMKRAVLAQETLEKMCKSKKFDEIQGDFCPLCNGHMRCLSQNGSSSISSAFAPVSCSRDTEETAVDEGEIVIGMYDLTVNSSVNRPVTVDAHQSTTPSSRGRYKRKTRAEDDEDWTIDQEYVPVSRRGRPKGTKTKPKPIRVLQRKCLLCFWTGPHTDVLAHAINQHCQPDMNYFPCPLCKYKQENEIELENHIEFHMGQYKERTGMGSQIVSGEGT